MTVTFHDTAGDRMLWSETFAAANGNRADLEMRIVRRLASALGVSIDDETQTRLGDLLRKNLAAQQAYEGWMEEIRPLHRSGFSKAMERLNGAIHLDPKFVEAYTALALSYRLMSEYERAPRDVMPEVLKHATLALQIDDSCVNAQSWIWGVKLMFDYDWKGAEAELKKIPESMRYNEEAIHLRMIGRLAEARAMQEKALAQAADDQNTRSVAIGQLLVERHYADALQFFQETTAMFPETTDYYGVLPRIYAELGDYPKAIAEINRLRSVADYPMLMGRLGFVYAKMGDTARAKATLLEMEALARTRYVSSCFIAWVHAALGEKEQAMTRLERAYEERSELLVQADDGGLQTDQAWDGLRDEPRFKALLKKVGLDVWPR